MERARDRGNVNRVAIVMMPTEVLADFGLDLRFFESLHSRAEAFDEARKRVVF
jgi:hypothetical protein